MSFKNNLCFFLTSVIHFFCNFSFAICPTVPLCLLYLFLTLCISFLVTVTWFLQQPIPLPRHTHTHTPDTTTFHKCTDQWPVAMAMNQPSHLAACCFSVNEGSLLTQAIGNYTRADPKGFNDKSTHNHD